MANLLKTPFRVEVCGGIASGKTTFAGLFADIADAVLEDFSAVPFWKAFYTSPDLYSFEAEVSFLLQHYHQIKKLALEGYQRRFVVCDFSFHLDRAYCAVSLDRRKRQAFEAIYDEILNDIGPPDVLVHLKCVPTILISRIRARAREQEALISEPFLGALDDAIDFEISQSTRPDATVRIDSHLTDFAKDPDTQERCRRMLLSKISM
jgi:deoxyadenosine/deoxycytidine kinase